TIVGWRTLRDKFSPGHLLGWDSQLSRAILAGCLPIGTTTILESLNIRIDILILGVYGSSRVLGQFQAAAWFAVGTYLVASLLMAVLFPKLSRLLQNHSIFGSTYVLSLLKNGLLITALAALVLWFAAPRLLPLLMGSDSEPAVRTLRILVPALPLVF